MTTTTAIFDDPLLEGMDLCDTEKAFITDMIEQGDLGSTAFIYADWLEENNRHLDIANEIRWNAGFDPVVTIPTRIELINSWEPLHSIGYKKAITVLFRTMQWIQRQWPLECDEITWGKGWNPERFRTIVNLTWILKLTCHTPQNKAIASDASGEACWGAYAEIQYDEGIETDETHTISVTNRKHIRISIAADAAQKTQIEEILQYVLDIVSTNYIPEAHYYVRALCSLAKQT